MRLKHLESALSRLDASFPSPNVSLEQYPTSPRLAASVVLTAHDRGDLFDGCRVCDLGCGTGVLSLSCALLLSSLRRDEEEEEESNDDDDARTTPVRVTGVDVCEEALGRARENARRLADAELLDEDDVDFVRARLRFEPSRPSSSDRRGDGRRGRGGRGRGRRFSRETNDDDDNNDVVLDSNGDEHGDGLPFASESFDAVVTNPPFGTKNNEGIDLAFVAAGIRLTRGSVYSFHKSSTTDRLVKKIRDRFGDDVVAEVEVIARMRFDLPNTYRFHKRDVVDVDVNLVRIAKNQKTTMTTTTMMTTTMTAGDSDRLESGTRALLLSAGGRGSSRAPRDVSDDSRGGRP